MGASAGIYATIFAYWISDSMGLLGVFFMGLRLIVADSFGLLFMLLLMVLLAGFALCSEYGLVRVILVYNFTKMI